MDGLTIVVPGRGPLRAEFLSAVEHLLQIGVADPFWVVDGSDDPALGVQVRRMGSPDLRSLSAVVASDRPATVQLITIGLVGDPAPDPAVLALRGDIESRLSGQQKLNAINVLVPVESKVVGETLRRDGRPSLARECVLSDWLNVVVSPEDRSADDRAMNEVRLTRSYLLHAAANLLVVSGHWKGMAGEPINHALGMGLQLGPQPHPNQVVVVRARSRTVTVPTITERVPGKVAGLSPPWPAIPDTQISLNPDELTSSCADQYIEDHPELRFEPPPLDKPEPRYPLTLAGLVHILRDFALRRVPELADEGVRSTSRELLDKFGEKLTDKVLGEDPKYQIVLRKGARVDDEEELTPDEELALTIADFSDLGEQWTPPAAPEAWRGLRATAFGLIDGGELPEKLEEICHDGPLRLRIPDPKAIAPKGDDLGWWEPPANLHKVMGWPEQKIRTCDSFSPRRYRERLEALSTEDLDPALGLDRQAINEAIDALDEAVEKRSSSLLWKVGAGLVDQIDASLTEFNRLAEIVRTQPKPEELAEAAREARKKLRRKFILKAILAVVAATVAVGLLIAFPPAGVVFAIAMVVVFAGFILGLLRMVGKYLLKTFQLLHRRDQKITEFEHACRSLPGVLVDIERLRAHHNQFLDWSEIIGVVVHDPFGPSASYPGEVHHPYLGDLIAHQVAEGEPDDEKVIGLVATERAKEFDHGWMNRAYIAAGERITVRYRNRAPDDKTSDPDYDTNSVIPEGIQPWDAGASRRFLLENIQDGRELFAGRTERYERVLESLSALPPDRLADRVVTEQTVVLDDEDAEADPDAVSDYLRTTLPSGPPADFYSKLFSDSYRSAGPGRPQGDVSVQARLVWTHRAVSGAKLGRAGVVNVFAAAPTKEPAYTVTCLDFSTVLFLSGTDPTAWALTCFGEDAIAIDASSVPGLFLQRTVPTDETTPVVVGPDRKLIPIKDHEVGHTITPRDLFPARPYPPGSYAFLCVDDGEPFRFPLDGPVPYHVRDVAGPPNGMQLVRDALQRVADVSGHSFIFQGFFQDAALLHSGRPPGDGLWIGWTTTDEGGKDWQDRDQYAGPDYIGWGGPKQLMADRTQRAGTAVLWAEWSGPAEFGPGASMGNLLLHEIGHAMNLEHVTDWREVMCPPLRHNLGDGFGPGDKLGLWILGIGRNQA